MDRKAGENSIDNNQKGERTMNDAEPSGTPPSIEGIVSRPSLLTVEETVARLKTAIQNRNLTLFAQIDHSDLARGVGLTMQEAHVLIFGSINSVLPHMHMRPSFLHSGSLSG
jgi:uncharacterized protein (DUF302 family)